MHPRSLITSMFALVLVALLAATATAAPRTPADLIETQCTSDNRSVTTVLVAYDTIHGSTAEVAAAIGQQLCDLGFAVDVRLVTHVDDVSAYDAVIIGSALYRFNFLRDALGFIRRNRATLAQLPTALFIVGASMSEDTPEARDGATRWFVDPVLERFPELDPVSVGLFGGAVDFTTNRYTLFERFVLRILGLVLGFRDSADWRDWQAIDQWAAETGALLIAQ